MTRGHRRTHQIMCDLHQLNLSDVSKVHAAGRRGPNEVAAHSRHHYLFFHARTKERVLADHLSRQQKAAAAARLEGRRAICLKAARILSSQEAAQVRVKEPRAPWEATRP